MKQLRNTLLFLILNFGGLAIGSWLMNGGPLSEWYTELNQAPWTPPGLIFGIAWTLVMFFFRCLFREIIYGRKYKKTDNSLFHSIYIKRKLELCVFQPTSYPFRFHYSCFINRTPIYLLF